jgi:V8-like Glu-specific endopeptidase
MVNLKRVLKSSIKPSCAMLAIAIFAWVEVSPANAQVKSQNGVTGITVGSAEAIDFVNAKAMPLPANFSAPDPGAHLQSLLSNTSLGTPGVSAGADGNGAQNSIFLGTPAASEGGIESQDYGTQNHPFTTAKADLNGGATNTFFPYRPAGKLFFKIGSSNYICSASLIKKGVVVTAAHCVANYGKKQFYGSWQFVPGYRNGSAPYGVWTVRTAYVLSAYYNGTDGCYQYGVICPDDVAILLLNPSGSSYPGTATGYYGYGWNGYGFVGTLTQITQLGYPAGLDNAAYMERNDSYGYRNSTYSNNTVIGSNMNGGSSGGPLIVNFGIAPTLTGETNGSAPSREVVVGVTSWGYTSTAPKEQGAAPFTSSNIVPLVSAACTAVPGAC